jgi:putative signal transducing protein
MGRVVVKTVASEMEAGMACALLCGAGISCSYREPDIAQQGFWGWRDILVDEEDLEAARELLAPAGDTD